MPTITFKTKKADEVSTRYVSEGIVESQYETTYEDTDTLKISGRFHSDTVSPSTKGKVEVEESTTV